MSAAPDDAPRQPRRIRRFELALIVGWWTLYGVLLTGQQLLYAGAAGQPLQLGAAVARAFFGAGVWAVITLAAFALSRRFPLDRRPGRAAAVLAHLTGGAALAAFEPAVAYAFLWATDNLAGIAFVRLFFQGFPANLLSYWLLVGVAHGLQYYRRYREREADAARLATRLARAELDLLKSQLQPHFLFNTLHAISSLMHTDVRKADRMLARLSELLRATLDHGGTEQVSLQEELEFLAPYVEIERARLGDRLTVDIDVAEEVLNAQVPHMLLQPIVENAIRHGVAPRAAPGRVLISARRQDGTLDVLVRDDGPGLRPGRPLGDGLGLANTRARLEQLYGRDFTFDAHNAPGGGFQVAMTLPFRTASAETPPPARA